MDKTFRGVVRAAVEQSRRRPAWLLRETGNLALEADPRIPQKQQKKKFDEMVITYVSLAGKKMCISCEKPFVVFEIRSSHTFSFLAPYAYLSIV